MNTKQIVAASVISAVTSASVTFLLKQWTEKMSYQKMSGVGAPQSGALNMISGGPDHAPVMTSEVNIAAQTEYARNEAAAAAKVAAAKRAALTPHAGLTQKQAQMIGIGILGTAIVIGVVVAKKKKKRSR